MLQTCRKYFEETSLICHITGESCLGFMFCNNYTSTQIKTPWIIYGNKLPSFQSSLIMLAIVNSLKHGIIDCVTTEFAQFENLDCRTGIFVEVLESHGIWTYRSIFLIISIQEFSRYTSSEIWLYLCALKVSEFIEKVLKFDIGRAWEVLESEMSKCVWTLYKTGIVCVCVCVSMWTGET